MGNKRNPRKVKKGKYHPYQRPPVPKAKPETNHGTPVLETMPEPIMDRPPDLFAKVDECSNCKVSFKIKKGGYHRFCVDRNLSTGQSARELLDQLLGVNTPPGDVFGRFLCPECWRLLNIISKYNNCVKQFFEATKPLSYVAKKSKRKQESNSDENSLGLASSHWPEDHSYHKDPNPKPPIQPACTKGKKVTSDDPKKSFKLRFSRRKRPETYSVWGSVICAIRARNYRRAISGLYQGTRATKRHFAAVAAGIVRKETRQLLETHDFLCQDLSVSAINEFTWDAAVDNFAEHAPLLFNVIRGAVTSRHNEKTMRRGLLTNLKPIIGTALAILLHARAPQTAKFLPSLFSLHFGRGKLKCETITQLYRLGLCLGYKGTMKIVDKIPSSVNSAALRLKSSVETEQESAMLASSENCEDAEGDDLPPENCDEAQDGDLNPGNSEDTPHVIIIKQEHFEDAEGDDLSPENCDFDEDLSPENSDDSEDDLNQEDSEDDSDDEIKQENFEDTQDGYLNPENPEDEEEGSLKSKSFEEDENVDSEITVHAREDLNSDIDHDLISESVKNAEDEDLDFIITENADEEDLNSEITEEEQMDDLNQGS